MAQNQKPFVGGILITLGLLIGSALGMAVGQPSAGFVIGLASGCILALLVDARTRNRGR